MKITQFETMSDAIDPLHGVYLSKQLCLYQISELDMYVSAAHDPGVADGWIFLGG
jgi:hypothetical protein